MDIQTRLVHAGEERVDGAVVLPIFQSSTYVSQGEEDYNAIRYLRLNNTPNQRALHAKLAAVCGGEAALVTGSGMAAITSAMLTVLNSGDHLLIQDSLYGGTHGFVTQDAPDLGLSYDFIAGNAPESWAARLRPETRAIYVETMTNPLLEVADLEAVVAFAREHGLVSLIDNTFASPCNFRPLEIGFDLELHSASKYLNGHSDLVAGVVAGSAARISAVTHKLNHLGGSLDAHACFLLHRGLKTLSLRMRQHDENGLRLARHLAEQEQVRQVNYPGLESHPQYVRAQRLFAGAGGVLSFELHGGVEAAVRLLSRLVLPALAPSLGGVETLISRPAAMSHVGLRREERAAMGIADGLVRVACGIEAAEDLCDDFAQALAGV